MIWQIGLKQAIKYSLFNPDYVIEFATVALVLEFMGFKQILQAYLLVISQKIF
jgi:hypothetical protein